MTYTLATKWLHANKAEADNLSVETVIAPFLAGKYSEAILRRMALRAKRNARVTGLDLAGSIAQIQKETGGATFTGDVVPEQFNLAGIGTTGGGVKGHYFASIEDGVDAFWAHHALYHFGPVGVWPAEWREFARLAVRERQVIGAGYGGTVHTFGDFTNGRWAYNSKYPVGTHQNNYITGTYGILAITNQLLAQEAERGVRPMNGKERTDALIATLRGRGREVIDLRGELPVNAKYPYRTIPLSGITKYVQHWTGDGFNRATIKQITGTDYGEDRISARMTVNDEIDLAKWYANYHISKEGGTWGGIAYGILVFPSGRIYVNWNLGTMTYHAFSVNGYSYAICTPSAQSQPPTAGQLLSLNHVWYYLCEETPEVPAGWSDLWGHKDCAQFDSQNQTSCPGVALNAQVTAARQAQAPTVNISLIGDAAPPRPTPPANDQITAALTGWYASLPENLQGNRDNANYYEATVDFSPLFPDIVGPQRAIFGEYVGAWFHPTGAILPIHPGVRVQLAGSGHIVRR